MGLLDKMKQEAAKSGASKGKFMYFRPDEKKRVLNRANNLLLKHPHQNVGTHVMQNHNKDISTSNKENVYKYRIFA